MQSTAQTLHTQDFSRRERLVFSQIPGMLELLHTAPDHRAEVEIRYPDAAFALMVADHLSMGDGEQNAIHQKAYLSILSGESIQNVRFRYDYDLEQYLERHMWD